MNKKSTSKKTSRGTILLGGLKVTEADKKAAREAIAKHRAQRGKKAA